MIAFNDQAGAPDFRVVQLTPHGSNSSIQFGVGLTDAPAGSVRGLYLVVRDIEACQRELTDRGLGVSEIRHKDTVVAGVADTCRASIRAAVTMRVSRISAIPTGMRGCCKNAAITRLERV